MRTCVHGAFLIADKEIGRFVFPRTPCSRAAFDTNSTRFVSLRLYVANSRIQVNELEGYQKGANEKSSSPLGGQGKSAGSTWPEIESGRSERAVISWCSAPTDPEKRVRSDR